MATVSPTMKFWAMAFSDERLAYELRKLAENVRWSTGGQRQAVLEEAARRIVGGLR